MTPDDQPTGSGDEPAAPPPGPGTPPPPPPSDPAGWAPPAAPAAGAPVAPPAGYGQIAPARTTNGKAVASLVMGIGGFLVCPLILSVLAIVFGSMAKKEIDANPNQDGRGLAQAGWILGIVGLSIVGLVLVIAIIAGAAGN